MSIVYQVEEDNRMPTGTKDDDGERSWNSFLTSNFGEPRKGLLKKYCYRRWLPKTWNSPSNTTPIITKEAPTCRPWWKSS